MMVFPNGVSHTLVENRLEGHIILTLPSLSHSLPSQLGGQMIMFPNGVSHTLVENHLEGIVAVLTWLSYVPSVRRGFLPIHDITGVDVVERAISFTPQKGIAYDPR